MANFKIGRGMQDGIPEALTDGMLYYCTDTTNLFIDYTDSNGNLVRSQLSANYANKLRYIEDGATVEIDPKDIALDSEVIHKNQPEYTNNMIGFIRDDDTIESPRRVYVNPDGVHVISLIAISNEGTDNERWTFKGMSLDRGGLSSKLRFFGKDDYVSGYGYSRTIISGDSDDSNIIFGSGTPVALHAHSKEADSSGTLIYTMKEDNDLELANKQYVDTNTADIVKYSEQTLTEDQQIQARTNIGAISSSDLVQGDWNQNDSTASDYIKNRTHYEEVVLTEILPETTVTIADDGGYEEFVMDQQLVEGETYFVTLNGTNYECIARYYSDEDYVLIGNGTIFGDGNEGNGEPFSCDSYSDGTIYLNVATAGEYTVSISYNATVVHKIEEKYLPESVLMQADWNQLDESAADYIKNKPDVDVIKSDITSLQTGVESIQSDIESIQTNITSLQTDVNTLNQIVSFDKITLTDIETGAKYDLQIKNGTLVTSFSDTNLADFIYTTNDDGTYTLTGWNGTLNGESSTEIVVPDISMVML